MRSALWSLLLLAPAFGAQEPQRQEPLDPDDIVADRALVSVDRKYASADKVGLYVREPDGKMIRVWTGEAYDARALPDRTFLVVERWAGRVIWMDRAGKVLFQKDGFDRPNDVELAADGSVVVVEGGKGRVVGLDPKTGAVRWTRSGFNDPFDCQPLPDGGLVVADSSNDRVVELDAEGKVRRTWTGIDFPNTVEKLDDGGILVTTWSSGEVIELGPDGKVRWRVRPGGTLYRAERRWDGLTLVCDGSGGRLIFLDPQGKRVKVERFQPGCVDYETIQEL